MELPLLPEHGGTDAGVEPLPGAPLVLGERERADIARDLANAVEGEVRFDPHNRMLYATDASLYQVEPIGVVIPASVEDARRAVEFCLARGLPILPRGGGTSLAGQCTNRAVVVDCSVNCRGVPELDAAGRRVRVEPGITIDDLNDQIAGSGLFFAPDPATSRHANVGGAIGNNAAGARSILYGRTAENLLGVDVVLGDGSAVRLEEGASRRDPRVAELTRRVLDVVLPLAPLIRARFPKTIRRNAGYALDMIVQQALGAGAWDGSAPDEAMLARVNLAHLICGSEGTLGLVLGADLKLHDKPRIKGLAVLGFDSLDAAIDAVLPVLATKPSAVELLDDMVIDLARANGEYSRYVELMPRPAAGVLKAVLYVEYFAGSGEEMGGRFAALRRLVQGLAGRPAMQEYTDAGAMLAAWKLRKAGEPLLHGIPGTRKPLTFVEDNAVPVENLAAFVREFRQIVERHGTRAAFWAHASVGVLHVRPLLDIHDEEDRRRMREIAVEVADLARRMGGVMSGEHGDGRARGPLLERFFGPEIMRAFGDVKRLFDPRNLFNPGDIVLWAGEPRSIESITQRLRVEPSPGRPAEVAGLQTYFTYEDSHGFASAVEMCNGAGVCRKKQGGTMCPSYMATLDERHSTRGRGNALRLAITGQLEGAGQAPAPASRWNDPATMETLDLCLSCKACKTECPSNVDVARLKAEYTAQRYRETGAPLAARILGHVRVLNRLGAMLPGVANTLGRVGPLRAIANAVLGFDPRRTLPTFATSLARSWGREMPRAEPRPTVILFGDCFTMYNEPGIGLATRRVLEAFGYRVVLADAGCCGRAMISLGLLGQAIERIDATAAALLDVVDREGATAIVVPEPSCLSAIKDDWLALRVSTPMDVRGRLAGMSFLPEQFLEARWDDHPGRATFRTLAPDERIILHAHCHQKSLWGDQSSAAPLRRLLGPRVEVLDSGCCGMAGSFGFGNDRYDLSMKIGERALLPAVREAGPADTIAAPGTSCRHQIHDGAGRGALHPIEVLASRLQVDDRYAGP